MFHTRRCIRGAVLTGLILDLAGCGAEERKPYLVILPTYSSTPSGVAMEVTATPLRISVASDVNLPRLTGVAREMVNSSPGM